MFKWLADLLHIKPYVEPEEKKLVLQFMADPQGNWENLTEYFNNLQEPFWTRGHRHYSQHGYVTVEEDMYHYVYIDTRRPSLSSAPDGYGLLRYQADLLESAILSCVIGTAGHVAKLEKRIRENSNVTTA